MANYIDRSDISLVLHSGNVVADAGAQSQWDVFNNAMQPLYDDEEVDVLMIAAEKPPRQPVPAAAGPRDFRREDLSLKTARASCAASTSARRRHPRRSRRGRHDRRGYKWAREKFNSDKDASGILLVNNYLLEDMRKPDKIDERALDLEKNVVKACSNVRMVLSSSGGYSSHYRFYYGERKVIAINSDIEAAARRATSAVHLQRGSQYPLSVTNLPVHLRLRV